MPRAAACHRPSKPRRRAAAHTPSRPPGLRLGPVQRARQQPRQVQHRAAAEGQARPRLRPAARYVHLGPRGEPIPAAHRGRLGRAGLAGEAEAGDTISFENSDLISFHNYQPARVAQRAINQLAEAFDRPLLCTECMARGGLIPPSRACSPYSKSTHRCLQLGPRRWQVASDLPLGLLEEGLHRRAQAVVPRGLPTGRHALPPGRSRAHPTINHRPQPPRRGDSSQAGPARRDPSRRPEVNSRQNSRESPDA